MLLQKGRILFNAMRTPDGTLLVSRHRHEYSTHTDTNGKHYMVDGGLDYIRCSMKVDQVLITITDADAFEDIRLVFGRFNKGKNFDQPLRYIPLCEMSNDYLEAVIEFCINHKQFKYIDLYNEELYYRMEEEIYIAD